MTTHLNKPTVGQDPHRLIRGRNLTFDTIKEWPSKKFMDFFNFFMFCAVKRPGTSVELPMEKILKLEQTPDWEEFIIRFNVPLRDYPQNVIETQYNKKMRANVNLVGRFLKAYPAFVDPSLKEFIDQYPKLHFITKHFKVEETKSGAIVILPDTTVIDDPLSVKDNLPAVKMKESEISLMESMLKVASVFDMIVSSIDVKQIKSMDVKTKIASLQKLSFVYTQSRNMKPNSTVFKQLNINTTKAVDLEKAVLAFAEEGSEDEQ